MSKEYVEKDVERREQDYSAGFFSFPSTYSSSLNVSTNLITITYIFSFYFLYPFSALALREKKVKEREKRWRK